jgi:hypothetical protein
MHVLAIHMYSFGMYRCVWSTAALFRRYISVTYIHTYIHIYIDTYTHTYIYTYIHTHTHTYIHTLTHIYSMYQSHRSSFVIIEGKLVHTYTPGIDMHTCIYMSLMHAYMQKTYVHIRQRTSCMHLRL